MQSTVQAVYHSGELLAKKPHFHDCHQIILIRKGEVEFCVNDARYRARQGHMAIFSRYENHSVRVLSREYDRYVLHIDPDVVNRASPVYSLLTDRPVGFCNVVDVSAHMEDSAALFRRLISEHSSGEKLAREMEQLILEQLLIILYRCMPSNFRDLQDDLVVSIKRQLENAYHQPCSLATLARQHSVSPSSLSHRFRAVTGTSVMAYLQSCRIAQAKRLLAGSELPVGEIVERCGFSDNSNFSRTFKRLTGLSPTDFRQNYTAE